jgi:hypothetical protein
MISVFERAKPVHALDCAATLIGIGKQYMLKNLMMDAEWRDELTSVVKKAKILEGTSRNK